MARLPLVDPAHAADPAAAALLERLAGERGRAFNVYRMLAHSPGAAERVYGLAAWLWQEAAPGPRVVELVILRVAQLTGSDYEWARHEPLALRAGVTEQQLGALSRWRGEGASAFDAAERAALGLAEEATRDVEASEATVAAARAAFGERGTVELLVLSGLYGMVARLLRSLDVDPEPGDRLMPINDINPE
jgi:AhpD family alkylhydroperoxidase